MVFARWCASWCVCIPSMAPPSMQPRRWRSHSGNRHALWALRLLWWSHSAVFIAVYWVNHTNRSPPFQFNRDCRRSGLFGRKESSCSSCQIYSRCRLVCVNRRSWAWRRFPFGVLRTRTRRVAVRVTRLHDCWLARAVNGKSMLCPLTSIAGLIVVPDERVFQYAAFHCGQRGELSTADSIFRTIMRK